MDAIEVVCGWSVCGVAFVPPQKAPWKRYCSKRCRERAGRLRRSGRTPGEVESRICRYEACGASFDVSFGRGGHRAYCSASCRSLAWEHREGQPSRERRRIQRLALVRAAGAQCSRCGYRRNLAALDFHHREPSTKLFGLNGHELQRHTTAEVQDEAAKGDLVCANCHREEHHPWALPEGVSA